MINLLFIGDIDDKPGLDILEKYIEDIKRENNIDVTIANGENAASGLGLDKKSANRILKAGVDLITLGNHTWSNRDINKFLGNEEYNVIRPINFPDNNPGEGYMCLKVKDIEILVINAHGQESILNILGKEIFPPCSSPFHSVNEFLNNLDKEYKIIIVDFHAESTIEKMAFANFMDGKVTAVLGTHTHVATADERILPGGTAYITDVGMTGAMDSIAGCNYKEVIDQYLNVIPTRWQGATENPAINAVIVSIDEQTGKAVSISRLRKS